MAGHSKWSKIKRSKGALDAKRGKIFTRCIKEISVAVKEGASGDPDANPRLRLAIDKARAANMPNDNIDRAIKRATGDDSSAAQVEANYEGYGPSGTAVLVETVTDNKNRTVSEVRHAFSKAGGNLGENGCVSYLFNKKGLVVVKKTENLDPEALMELALENGADDLNDEGDVWEITSTPEDFFKLQEALSKNLEIEMAEVQMLPVTRLELDGKDAESLMKLVEALEDLDDVMNVFTNADFGDEE